MCVWREIGTGVKAEIEAGVRQELNMSGYVGLQWPRESSYLRGCEQPRASCAIPWFT